jgi:hypothetical protein
MISLLTVQIDGCKEHLKVLLDSVFKRSKLVTEVIIAISDATDPTFYDEKLEGKIKIKRVATDMCGQQLWYGHGLGLCTALSHASNPFVIFHDPDCFWYTAVDEFYIDLYNKYNLNYIGVSHHNGINQCFTYFPYVISSMAKVATLPNKDWLKGKLKFRGAMLHRAELKPDDPGDLADGKFLIPNPIPDLCNTYPNKNDDAIFDIGCNMWLWNEERKGKWLSFQTLDCHTYTSRYYRSNFKLSVKFPLQNLVYHLGSGSRNESDQYNKLKSAYEQSFLQEAGN